MQRIGFVGTGAISEAVVRGLCALDTPPVEIIVSPRSASRAALLAKTFSNVRIAKDNQDVVDSSDTVFLAVLPDNAVEVISELKFRAGQQIISAVAIVSLETWARVVAPATEIVRMVPLPPIAMHRGPIAMCPPNEKVAAVFGQMGALTQVETEAQMHALAAVTTMMGSYFGFMNHMKTWLEAQNVAPALAQSYIESMAHALAITSVENPDTDFAELIVEHSTPGGMNEQALRELTRAGWGDLTTRALDLVQDRMNGKADFNSRL